MLESLLAFFTMMLWLEPQQETYYWSGVEITGYIETGDISYDMNLQEIQKNIIIEDYFLFLDRLWRINYARGCAWEATPPTYINGKRARCWIKSFDCWGMMKYYWRVKWILEKWDMVYLRSDTLYWLWFPKDPRTAERWDFMYRKWYGKSEWETHFAVVSSWYNEDTHSMLIYDNMWDWRNKAGEREIKVSCNSKLCHYAWMFRIYIATNWLVEVASKRWILVNAFKISE